MSDGIDLHHLDSGKSVVGKYFFGFLDEVKSKGLIKQLLNVYFERCSDKPP